MKFLVTFLPVFLLAACASTGSTTSKTVEPQVAAYKSCVMDRSVPMAPSPESTAHIVKDAADRCENRLEAVRRGLMKENEGATFAGRFANMYTDNLKKQTMAEASAQVDKLRKK